jgi:hypothetical protein
MKKFEIMIEGKNFLIRIDDEIRRVGFFTTRFVEANNAAAAEGRALDLVRDELRDRVLNERTNPPMMFIKRMDEVSSFGDRSVPGKGFSWYPEDREK